MSHPSYRLPRYGSFRSDQRGRRLCRCQRFRYRMPPISFPGSRSSTSTVTACGVMPRSPPRLRFGSSACPRYGLLGVQGAARLRRAVVDGFDPLACPVRVVGETRSSDIARLRRSGHRSVLPAVLAALAGRRWGGGCYASDYFARRADGMAVVIDVRRVEPQASDSVSAVASAVFDQVGWEHVRVGRQHPVLTANLRWLAGYRHPRCDDAERAVALREAFAVPRTDHITVGGGHLPGHGVTGWGQRAMTIADTSRPASPSLARPTPEGQQCTGPPCRGLATVRSHSAPPATSPDRTPDVLPGIVRHGRFRYGGAARRATAG